jgi:lipopolysaccharide assembly outer membrane protein LptD (OstA)
MLPFRSGCARTGRVLLILFLVGAVGSYAIAGEGKGLKRKKQQQAQEKKDEEGKEGLGNIPLPVGHEAKGLVLPDFDVQGHLRDRFEAGRAKRIDQDHVQLRDLKMTTYNPGNKTDLNIDMSDSVLNLKTRVINSQQHTTVRRADFRIDGDTMQFDTTTRQGTLVGNVKMVITGQSNLMPKGSE